MLFIIETEDRATVHDLLRSRYPWPVMSSTQESVVYMWSNYETLEGVESFLRRKIFGSLRIRGRTYCAWKCMHCGKRIKAETTPQLARNSPCSYVIDWDAIDCANIKIPEGWRK